MKFLKGLIIGAAFATPALFMYASGHPYSAACLVIMALIGGILVDLEVI